jgi:guanylate kinase
MDLASLYDVRIVNDDLERATEELAATIDLYEMDGGPTKDVSDQA